MDPLQKYWCSVKGNASFRNNARLSTIQNDLKDIAVDLAEAVCLNRAFIAGGCAAWLVNRFDEYNDIDIFVFYNRVTKAQEIMLISKRYERVGEFECSYDNCKRINQVNKKVTMVGVKYNLIFLSAGCASMMKLFDLDCISVFIKLKNTFVIYSRECPCSYKDQMITPASRCFCHSIVRCILPILHGARTGLPVPKYAVNPDTRLILYRLTRIILCHFCLTHPHGWLF